MLIPQELQLSPKFSHRYYFIFSLKGLDLSGKSLELFTTSQALF